MKDWEDLSQEERNGLETQWAEEPGTIDYVIAHLRTDPDAIRAAADVLQEIKDNYDQWLNLSPEEILYLLNRRML